MAEEAGQFMPPTLNDRDGMELPGNWALLSSSFSVSFCENSSALGTLPF